MSARIPVAAGAVLLGLLASDALTPLAWSQDRREREDPVGSRIDPYAGKTRLLVLTDIANEPDDQMSMVRLLVYANHFDIEGLVATTSTWMKDEVRPDVIRALIDGYEEVQPRLAEHAPGFPTAAAVRDMVTTGQPTYGMAAVGPGRTSPGSTAIVQAADSPDPRPLWITVWGGANTLAQALLDVRATRSPEEVERVVSRLRVYSISDQDDAGPWIRREFPGLHYIVMPSSPNGQQYYYATWTGISGDRYYHNCDGADFTTFTDAWVDANIRSKGALGELYPHAPFIHEGDTPSFLGLVDNGLASAMSPAFGGWGGRYVWRQFYGETRPLWTQGGDSFPGADSSRDTVVGTDGLTHVSDQATIWRWRQAFQHDFAARMDWTLRGVREANHNPEVVVNGLPGRAPLALEVAVGEEIALDASETRDPDGDALTYHWFFYPEAGMGIPGRPVSLRPPWAGLDLSGASGGGLPAPRPRVTIEDGASTRPTIVPKVAGTAHVILEVEDDGQPSLTSYRRIILDIRPGPGDNARTE